MNITDLASLPTDNLYKFMAMSGILVAGASVALAAHHYRLVQRRYFEVKRRTAVQKEKLKGTQASIESCSMFTSKLKRELLGSLEPSNLARSTGSTEAEFASCANAIASIEEAVTMNAKAIAQHGVEVAEIEADTGELETLSAQLRTLTRISLIGVAFGASLMGVGLLLWYTRVQVLLDQALAIQSALPK